jgi:hypothetical protein
MENVNLSQTQTGSMPNGPDEDAKRAQEEQMRRDMIATILEPAARERRKFNPRDTLSFSLIPVFDSFKDRARQPRQIDKDRESYTVARPSGKT